MSLSMLRIIDIQNLESEKWDSYVFHHDKGTIFQTSSYLASHTPEFKSESFGFAAVEGDDIVGLVAGVITYNYFYPINYLTRRAVIEGGPIADNKNIAEKLLAAVTDYTKNKAVYTQYRNLWDMGEYRPALENMGYNYEPHLDIIHDLTIDKESIVKGISKNKRGNIHKSLNKGTIFREAVESEWDRCIDLILGTYKRVGLPCQSRAYFVNAFSSMSDCVKVFVVEYEDMIIGTRVELCYKGLVYDWYAGADDNYRNCYPNDVLPYSILLWGSDHGYESFDFGGAGKPGVPYGVRDHKLKFGGQLVEYGRYERINSRLVYAMASRFIAWKKKAKRQKG